MSDLLPCPFCEGEAQEAFNGEGNFYEEWIQCTNCLASANTAGQWNTRADNTVIRELAEALGYYAERFSNANGKKTTAQKILTKHAERIKQAEEKG